MAKKTRTRTIIVPARRRVSRILTGVGGWKGLAKNAMIGLGALAIGNMVASRTGLDPRITGGILGLFFGGLVGAGTAVAVPTVMQKIQPVTSQPEGQIWV
jgi:ABC-type branched-subunit amino acid transport system permease subunit